MKPMAMIQARRWCHGLRGGRLTPCGGGCGPTCTWNGGNGNRRRGGCAALLR